MDQETRDLRTRQLAELKAVHPEPTPDVAAVIARIEQELAGPAPQLVATQADVDALKARINDLVAENERLVTALAEKPAPRKR